MPGDNVDDIGVNDLDLVIERTGHTRFRQLVVDRPEYVAVVADLARVFRGMPAPPKPPGEVRGDGVAPAVVLRSYVSSWIGYGQAGEWVGRELEAKGLPVGYWTYALSTDDANNPPFVTNRVVSKAREGVPIVQMAVPQSPVTTGRTIVYTMWETTRLKPNQVEQLNRAAAVVVPCVWNARCFAESGVTVPIHVVPLGVASVEGYTPKPWQGGPFTFGMAGRMAHGGARKGINEGMAAFVRAFDVREDVRLVVKVFPDCVAALKVPNDHRIQVIAETWPQPKLAEWYGSIHCLLVPSKGEGFGLHTLQAMACGRPVIAANVTGTAEFWTPACGWELSGAWEPSGPSYGGIGDWFVPSEGSIIDALRAAYHGQDEARRKGEAAAARAAEFPWTRTGEGVRAVLAGLGWVGPVNGEARAKLHKAATVAKDRAIRCDHRSTIPCGCGMPWRCDLHGGKHAPTEVCQPCPDRTSLTE